METDAGHRGTSPASLIEVIRCLSSRSTRSATNGTACGQQRVRREAWPDEGRQLRGPATAGGPPDNPRQLPTPVVSWTTTDCRIGLDERRYQPPACMVLPSNMILLAREADAMFRTHEGLLGRRLGARHADFSGIRASGTRPAVSSTAAKCLAEFEWFFDQFSKGRGLDYEVWRVSTTRTGLKWGHSTRRTATLQREPVRRLDGGSRVAAGAGLVVVRRLGEKQPPVAVPDISNMPTRAVRNGRSGGRRYGHQRQ
jgi:hypothetical protein